MAAAGADPRRFRCPLGGDLLATVVNACVRSGQLEQERWIRSTGILLSALGQAASAGLVLAAGRPVSTANVLVVAPHISCFWQVALLAQPHLLISHIRQLRLSGASSPGPG